MATYDRFLLLLLTGRALVAPTAGAGVHTAPESQHCRAREPRGPCRAADRPVDHVLLQHSILRTPPKSQVPPESAIGDFCHTSQPGERCHTLIAWILRHDLADHPQRYPGLTSQSTIEEVQTFLHGRKKPFCPQPCGTAVVPPRDFHPGTPGAEPCVSNIVQMDFFGTKVDVNEDHEIWEQPLPMRYRGLGHVNGRPFDLIVSSESPFVDVTGGLGNGGSKFGSVIVRPGVEAKVRFDFVDAATGTPVVLPQFHFSLFDLDASPSDGWRPGVEEAYVGGFEDYALAEGSEVRAARLADGRTSFTATRIGFGCDNPVDPLRLGSITCPYPLHGHTVDQRKRTVTFLFRARSGLEATFAAPAGGGWRSFMFAGSTNLARTCDEPAPTPAPSPRPPQDPRPDLGLCAAFGDPHFITFDGGHTVLFGERALWLVRSQRVWVQGWSRKSQGRLTAVAIGGDFLQGHTLVVYKSTPSAVGVLYDGRPVMSKIGSTFTVAGVVEGFYSKEWRADLHDGSILKLRTELKFDIGPWPERFQGEPEGGLVLLKLPEGVELTATGVNYMSVVLTMSPQEGGQGGFCGNFNGDAEDDAKPVGPSFNVPLGQDLDPIPEAENLFKITGVEDAITAGSSKVEADAISTRRDPLTALSSCDPALKEKAERRCLNVPDARLRADCVLDICMTGDVRAADDMIAADILEEKVNTRGIPAFMGHGQCLDSEGQPYSGYSTTVTTEKQCMEVLQHLAIAKGVVGAQLRVNAVCEVLLEAGSGDPRVFEVPGGWGGRLARRTGGKGLVSSASGGGQWKCWHLS